MTSNWSFSILHYDKSNSWDVQDLTEAIDGIPRFTDTGTDQVNTAQVVLDANLGHYIRNARVGESGFPVKIDHKDRIRITVLDGSGVPGQAYDKVFEVKRKVPSKSKDGGTQLVLELIGIERYLQKTHYTKPHYFTVPNLVFEDIINSYNKQAQAAVNIPIISGHLTTDSTNQLPGTEGQIHHFDFGISEEYHYDRILELLDKQGSSGEAGGVLDFFDVFPTYASGNVTSFIINAVSQGSANNDSLVTIDTSIDGEVNHGDTDGGIDEEQGTLINIWASNDAGTLPIDYSRFRSRQILMPTNQGDDSQFPTFTSGVTYKQGAIVVHNGLVYKAGSDTTSTPPTGWTQLTTETYYGGIIQYSPWTDDKVAEWKNSGADPGDQFIANFGPSMWDGNLIVNDDVTFRTWVDVIATDPSLLNVFWTYNNNLAGVYDGLRVLVDGVGTGDFAGHDNKIMEFNNGFWRVKYDPSVVGNMQVVVMNQSRVYLWDSPNPNQWNNISLLDNGSDCLHPYTSIENSESAIINADTGLEFLGTNSSSSIKIRYEWSPLSTWLSDAFNNRKNADYYRSGAWLCLRIPYPINTYNSISEGVGGIYGGGGNPDNPKAPASIDDQNMHLTHDGKRGFNQGLSSEDFGPLSALEFFMKLHYTNIGNPASPVDILKGNFKMRCFIFDNSDHVAYQDFTISHNNNWQSVSLPLSGFQIYRGRRPRYDPNIVVLNDIIPPKGLDINEGFEFRHIRMICWQTLESYDDFGRYHGGRGDFGALNLFGNTRRIDLYLDGLRFKKPLLVNTGQVTDLDIEPDFLQRPDIFIYDQAKNDAFTELEKSQFKNTKYDISTTGRFDIPFSKFFYLKDDEIIDESDDEPNKVKLVAKHIEYSITEVNDAEGGFKRKILGVRRFI